MELSPLSRTASSAAASNAPAPEQASALSSDFETFLKMLTTQMRNQDPLNPVDSADFAVQLATFSSVEQQVRTNDLLVSLGDRMGGANLGQMSSWIGRDVRSTAPVLFTGQPVAVTVHPDSGAEKTELVVRNTTGAEIGRSTIPPGVTEFDWVGVDNQGAPFPNGEYVLSTESFSRGEVTGANPAEIHGHIVEVQLSGEATLLKLQSGQIITPGDIRALSAAAQPTLMPAT